MSIALMTAAWALEIASTDKLVLLALADNANDAGCCWPAMGTIARKCGLTDRAVRAAMRRLEAAGHVSSVERSGTSRLYTVHPGTTFRPEPASARNDVPVTPEPRSPKPSRTTTSTKTTSSPKKRARATDSVVVPEWVPADAWNRWLEMRRAKGKPPDAGAIGLALGKLRKLADDGHPPGDVLDESTLNQWTGLFPLKDNRHERSGSPAPHGAARGARSTVTDAVLAAYDRVSFEG